MSAMTGCIAAFEIVTKDRFWPKTALALYRNDSKIFRKLEEAQNKQACQRPTLGHRLGH